MKRINISKELFETLKLNELIDATGSIVSGNVKNTPFSSKVSNIKKKRMQPTTDDFQDEAVPDDDMYYYNGTYTIHESDVNEDIVKSKNSGDVITNSPVIPALNELSNTYGLPDLEHNVNSSINIMSKLDGDNAIDVQAIVLKAILEYVDLDKLPSNYKRELVKLFG